MTSTVKTKVNVNTKHLVTGDPLPPFKGKPRLYSMRYCPFAQRVALTFNAKNIDYEVVNIDLVHKPEWLASKSVQTKVPSLEISDGVCINESLVIVEYIEDAYPQKPLLPKDPVKKALDKALAETCTTLMHTLLFKLVKSPETINDEVVAGYHQALDLLQNRLQQRGTKFLDGEEPGYVDYMMWPWFERLDTFEDECAQIIGSKYKTLLEYLKRMWEDPIVKDYAVPAEYMVAFYRAFFQNKKTNFDRLLVE